MKVDLNEIKDWREFEELIADFFREEYKNDQNNVQSVVVDLSGKGPDGGRDILVTFRFNDSLVYFDRKWVVQCKFYNKTVSKSHIADVNIPTLIHQYGANGYILITKGDVSSKLTEMFEDLQQNCSFGYQYLVWTGSQLVSKMRDKPALAQYYFPKSSQSSKKNKK